LGSDECKGGLNSAPKLFDILVEGTKTFVEGVGFSGRKETDEE
jgi:hypothetical protein